MELSPKASIFLTVLLDLLVFINPRIHLVNLTDQGVAYFAYLFLALFLVCGVPLVAVFRKNLALAYLCFLYLFVFPVVGVVYHKITADNVSALETNVSALATLPFYFLSAVVRFTDGYLVVYALLVRIKRRHFGTYTWLYRMVPYGMFAVLAYGLFQMAVSSGYDFLLLSLVYPILTLFFACKGLSKIFDHFDKGWDVRLRLPLELSLYVPLFASLLLRTEELQSHYQIVYLLAFPTGLIIGLVNCKFAKTGHHNKWDYSIEISENFHGAYADDVSKSKFDRRKPTRDAWVEWTAWKRYLYATGVVLGGACAALAIVGLLGWWSYLLYEATTDLPN